MNRIVDIRRLLGPVAVATALGACGGGSTSPEPSVPPPPAGSGTVVHDEIEYSAVVHVMESFPVQLAGEVTVTNQASARRTVVFPDGCVALLRAYRPDGGEPAWDQGRDVACTLALVPLTLVPGGSRTFRTPTSSARDILGDDLPDGTYRITVYLRPDGDEVEIDAGTADLAIPR